MVGAAEAGGGFTNSCRRRLSLSSVRQSPCANKKLSFWPLGWERELHLSLFSARDGSCDGSFSVSCCCRCVIAASDEFINSHPMLLLLLLMLLLLLLMLLLHLLHFLLLIPQLELRFVPFSVALRNGAPCPLQLHLNSPDNLFLTPRFS